MQDIEEASVGRCMQGESEDDATRVDVAEIGYARFLQMSWGKKLQRKRCRGATGTTECEITTASI